MDIALIPESAPFNPEQRAWLNGFLAGWLGLNPAAAPPARTSPRSAPAAAPAAAPTEPAPAPEPWHDPTLALDDRLKLAENEPLPRRLMAAMAQLDCGACGYVCRTYAEAIAGGTESRLTLCSPGGGETAKTLKRLVKGHGTTAPAAVAAPRATAPTAAGWSRDNPFPARVVSTTNLNRPGSEKQTHHVELDLGADGPAYRVGDSLGVYPENCPELIAEIVATLGARGDEPAAPVSGSATTVRDALLTRCCLSELTEGLFRLLAGTASDPGEAAALRGLLDDDGEAAGCDVLDLLRRFPSARPPAGEVVARLAPVRPRLYSISSSPKRHAGRVHLTVRRVAYTAHGRERKGVASTMLADRVAPGSVVRVFVQPSHGFTLPADPSTPVIMVGPGTGIAPFRAFLHERDATGAGGPAWLFFGDQRGDYDFLYREELNDLLSRGVLTRLDTAFSRDQAGKVYVQDRIDERGAEVFRWLEDGAVVYVCGDARRMAADVDRALRRVVHRHGGLTEPEAGRYIAALARDGRYRKDVY